MSLSLAGNSFPGINPEIICLKRIFFFQFEIQMMNFPAFQLSLPEFLLSWLSGSLYSLPIQHGLCLLSSPPPLPFLMNNKTTGIG